MIRWRVSHHMPIDHAAAEGTTCFYCSLEEIASGSLFVGGLSAPLLEYSLHLLAAAAALLALSFTSSSVKAADDKSTIQYEQFHGYQI